MTRLISTLAATTLIVFAPALAPAQQAQTEGVINETLIKIETPEGTRYYRLGEGVEMVDVTKGRAVRFNYEAGTIDAIEVTPDGAPVEAGDDSAAQAIGKTAPKVDGSSGSASEAAAQSQGTVAEVIVRIDTPDGPRWYQLGQGVKAVDVTKGKAVRFSYEEDTIDAITVKP